MKLTLVAGARPNFIKIAPILHAIKKSASAGHSIHFRLIHTGQHYDDSMSLSFFEDLRIPKPDLNLGAGSGSQAEQTAAIMVAFEKELIDHPSNAIIVVGDVNSTLACSIVAKKLLVDVVHVEAGIRSGDRTMPEEINRIVTDSISDQFFTTTPEASMNLQNAGIDSQRIHFVGNTMIDSLVHNVNRLLKPPLLEHQSLSGQKYLVLTLHRPSNVDQPDALEEILTSIASASGNIPIVFPVHPRTKKTLQTIAVPARIIMAEPMRYLEFMYLVGHAQGVITDSGGIQEETTYLHVPCITLRNSTERPETVTIGTNELVGNDKGLLMSAIRRMLTGNWKKGRIPDRWDGNTSERIIEKLIQIYS